ncbi:MAG: glutathione S-transferase family protein [Telmatospirillum sp.]|nr:glutathione S-transferase family protein [Telmatospirillum sp.]
MTVWGDSRSGNCLKVKFVADFLGIPYRWVETSVLKAETRTSDFLAINPAGQVPVVVLPDGQPLAQSNAIMLFLAEGSDLIPGDRVDRALMFQWLFWEQYSHEPVIAVRRFQKVFLGKPDADIDPLLLSRGERVLGLMDAHLAGRSYFVGDRLSLADVALVAYTRFAGEAGFDLVRWPHVAGWVGRVEAALGLMPPEGR